MRAAAIFGLGCSAKNLKAFQIDGSIAWQFEIPSAADDADVILLFGGDGTVHRHLRALVKLGLPALAVPVGSGNDFSSALGLRSVRDSVAAWWRFCAARDNVRLIDLGEISALRRAPAPHEPRYFCSVAGVGLDAVVSRRANALPRWVRGHGGYALSLIPAIFSFQSSSMKISAQDMSGAWTTLSDQSTLLAAFANTSTYGGGMKIAPRAKMDDGLLDLCVIADINRYKLAGVFPSVYVGRHLGIREVNYLQAARVRVETEKPMEIYADGEFVCHTPAEIGIARGALRVLTP
jgi:diacylglycerol kinase (ATP)